MEGSIVIRCSQVEVTGHFHGCPLIRFLGRQGYVSDWFGEKLNEAHVSGVLKGVFDALGMAPAFAMLACETDLPSPGYVLYIYTLSLTGCWKGPPRGLKTDSRRIFIIGMRANWDSSRRFACFARKAQTRPISRPVCGTGFGRATSSLLLLTGATGGPVFSAAKLLCEDDLFLREQARG